MYLVTFESKAIISLLESAEKIHWQVYKTL